MKYKKKTFNSASSPQLENKKPITEAIETNKFAETLFFFICQIFRSLLSTTEREQQPESRNLFSSLGNHLSQPEITHQLRSLPRLEFFRFSNDSKLRLTDFSDESLIS